MLPRGSFTRKSVIRQRNRLNFDRRRYSRVFGGIVRRCSSSDTSLAVRFRIVTVTNHIPEVLKFLIQLHLKGTGSVFLKIVQQSKTSVEPHPLRSFTINFNRLITFNGYRNSTIATEHHQMVPINFLKIKKRTNSHLCCPLLSNNNRN